MISVIYNYTKDRSEKGLDIIKKFQNKLPFELFFIHEYPVEDAKILEKVKASEALIILGGDGTVLSAISGMGVYDVPILTANTGTKGFINSIEIERFEELLESYIGYLKDKDSSRIFLDKRNLIEATINGKTYKALNDFVIQKEDRRKMITLNCWFNGTKLLKVRADGLIVSSSTGSTAYNLAAGGPIVSPRVQAMIFNVMSPHSLTVKPIIVAPDDYVEVEAEQPFVERQISHFVIDGVREYFLKANERVKFRLSYRKVTFVRLSDDNYYLNVQKKLNWGV